MTVQVPMRRASVLGWVVILFVAAAVVAGFLVIGSPVEARKRTADEQRISDLQSLCEAVRSYYVEQNALPTGLDQCSRRFGPSVMDDPVTHKPYEYRVVDKTHFELAATYEADTTKDRMVDYGYLPEISRRHPRGRVTYTLTAKRSL